MVGPFTVGRRAIVVVSTLLWAAARLAVQLLRARLSGTPGPADVMLARAAASSCERLNGALLKAAQLLGTRHDLLPPEVLAEFRGLHDRVRPAPADAIIATIERAFERPLGDLFTSFDSSACASGSIAQVHRARLRGNGREVAVKVVRPAVREAVLADTALLCGLAAALNRLPRVRHLALAEGIAEVAAAVAAQLDLQREAEAYERFRYLFVGEPDLGIPAVHRDLCRETVLVADYWPGLTRIDSPAVSLDSHRRALDTLLETLYRMIFEHGVFHCDLHPGNVLVAPDGRLVLLDMGMIAELPRPLRQTFRDFFMCVALNRGERAAAILRQTATPVRAGVDELGFTHDIAALVRGASHASAGTFQVARFTASLFEIQRRHGLKGSPQFTLAIVALLTFEGLAKQRYGELDFLRVAVTMAIQGNGARPTVPRPA